MRYHGICRLVTLRPISAACWLAGPIITLGADDQRQYTAPQRLRDADERAALAAFDELTQVLASIMPGWKIHQSFVAPVLRAAGLDFSQVAAYVNLLNWRTTASSGLPGCMHSVVPG